MQLIGYTNGRRKDNYALKKRKCRKYFAISQIFRWKLIGFSYTDCEFHKWFSLAQ